MFENIVNIGGDYAKTMGGGGFELVGSMGVGYDKIENVCLFMFFCVGGGGDDYVVKLGVGDCPRE